MRKLLSFSFIIGLLFIPAALAAQAHTTTPVKTTKDQVLFETDVMVGTTLLKAGEYAVAGDATQVTFTRLMESTDGPGHWQLSKDKPVVIAIQAKALPKKAENTEMEIPVNASGVHVLATLCLRGSTVEYTFSN
jgi:hypothetical protein